MGRCREIWEDLGRSGEMWGDHLEEVVVLHEDLEVLVRDDLECGLGQRVRVRVRVGFRVTVGARVRVRAMVMRTWKCLCGITMSVACRGM